MSELALHLVLDPGANGHEVTESVKRELGRVPFAGQVDARPEQPRLGLAEVVVLLTGIGAVVHGTRLLVEDVQKILEAVRKSLVEIKGIRDAFVEIGLRRVRIAEVTEEDLKELAEK